MALQRWAPPTPGMPTRGGDTPTDDQPFIYGPEKRRRGWSAPNAADLRIEGNLLQPAGGVQSRAGRDGTEWDRNVRTRGTWPPSEQMAVVVVVVVV